MTSSVSFSCTRMVVRKWYVPSSCAGSRSQPRLSPRKVNPHQRRAALLHTLHSQHPAAAAWRENPANSP